MMTVNEQFNSRVAVVSAQEGVVLSSVQDALDLMATMRYQHDASKLLLPKACICEEFFDLKTGIAGEILQKYTTYGIKVAIVGDFSGYTSKSLRDFIRESNRGSQIWFLPTEQEALERLHGMEKDRG